MAGFSGLLVLVAADAASGLVYRTNTAADVTVLGATHGGARRAIVLLPGYVMSGRILGRAFAPHLQPDDVLIVVDYAERGVDPDDIYVKVMAALRSLQPRELSVYGASMGGILGVLLLQRYHSDGQPFGRASLILDSAPAGPGDVKRSSWLFSVGCRYHGGLASSLLWAVATRFSGRPPLEPDADSALAASGRHAGQWAGLPAASTQGCFIAHAHPPPTGSADLAKQVVYLQGHDPEDDPVVRIAQSVEHWRYAFPTLTVVTIASRPGRCHLPLVERPGETVAAIMAVN